LPLQIYQNIFIHYLDKKISSIPYIANEIIFFLQILQRLRERDRVRERERRLAKKNIYSDEEVEQL
jgi:hypothetical protein